MHCSQVGFSLIVHFSTKTRDKLTKTDFNFSCSYWPQNAPDCISGPDFFKNYPGGACPRTPPRGFPGAGYFQIGGGYSKISGEHWVFRNNIPITTWTFHRIQGDWLNNKVKSIFYTYGALQIPRVCTLFQAENSRTFQGLSRTLL